MQELHIAIIGNVQGVGFRWTVQNHAENHNIKGTVKNLTNGNVEVIAQGSKENLEAFVQAIKENPESARIDKIKCQYRESQNSFSEFRIIS